MLGEAFILCSIYQQNALFAINFISDDFVCGIPPQYESIVNSIQSMVVVSRGEECPFLERAIQRQIDAGKKETNEIESLLDMQAFSSSCDCC